MVSEHELEVYRQFRNSQDKYSYFLLAAIGAAIGFALNQTSGKALSFSKVPLGVSLFFWSLSFFFGCLHLNYVSSNLFANLELLKVEKGQHPNVGNNPQVIQATLEGIRKAMKTNLSRSTRYVTWQFWFFVGGVVSYIIWHVIEMWLVSKS